MGERLDGPRVVRKHRAPKGALRRCANDDGAALGLLVRKHRAPKGALRQSKKDTGAPQPVHSQKAPSAKRCIKTERVRAAERPGGDVSESTERQKVH